jgi:outer membrane protein assembly factor BamE (lipoprotein component of BamABCDE complex)
MVRRGLLVMMAVALLAALGACTTAPAPSTSAPPPAAKLPPVPVPRPEPPLPARRLDPSPQSLNGLSRDEIRALLGPPASETSQAMATVWSYRKGSCALSLVFYPEVETATERVLSYEFKPEAEAATCLNRLREARSRNGK